MENIKLNSIVQIPPGNLNHYKLHLASSNGDEEPLDLCLRDGWEGFSWNRWNNAKDDFNRKYLFVLIKHYKKEDKWFFGGVYQVIKRDKRKDENGYTIRLENFHRDLIGRLLVGFKRRSGMLARAYRLETFYDEFTVSEVLNEEYTGEEFPGYENINIDFKALEHIHTIEKSDWKAALENVKGVYLISDISNGKKYVGSAYGTEGIWSRWRCYVKTRGHGGNDDLVRLIKQKGPNYALKNFKISLLEYRAAKTDDNVILERERFWKNVLLSR